MLVTEKHRYVLSFCDSLMNQPRYGQEFSGGTTTNWIHMSNGDRRQAPVNMRHSNRSISTVRRYVSNGSRCNKWESKQFAVINQERTHVLRI
jgi:hypothetical protein